ncbi:hypothetical protein SDC9_185728 [bioreactor metagenome]|uniref:Uncharacterized protein n=1 Tax=bioreactor metagenome TaxID=1076179 RepID=A0A645HPZ6_9ZZZZ
MDIAVFVVVICAGGRSGDDVLRRRLDVEWCFINLAYIRKAVAFRDAQTRYGSVAWRIYLRGCEFK